MGKSILTFAAIVLLIYNAGVKSSRIDIVKGKTEDESSAENNQSPEQLRELEIDDLIRSLEQRLNAKEANSKEAYDVINEEEYQRDSRGLKDRQQQEPSCDKADVFFNPETGYRIHPNPRDRKLLNAMIDRKETNEQTESPTRVDKRKTVDTYDDLDELRKEAYGQHSTRSLGDAELQRNQLSDFDKDEQYYRNLLQMQQLYRLYNRRYLDEDPFVDERPSRHCGGDLIGKKMDLIQHHKLRYLERSRHMADRIADAAMHLARKKGRILEHLHRPGCGSCRVPVEVIAAPSPQAIYIPEEATKRDVEASVSTSAAASTSIDANVGSSGVSVDTDIASQTSASLSTSGGVSAGVSSAVSAGISAGTSGSLNLERKGFGYPSQYSSIEDYERKMIMDMAIEEAAGMIRKLAQETRSEIACKEDPDFDRRVLGLAIDLVNKVTTGVTGDINGKFDILGGFRYNNVDDYLKSSIYDSDYDGDLISNAGFDFVNPGLNRHLDIYDDYVGHASPFSRGRCDTCSKYDPRLGEYCPLCKRSETVFHGRTKRKFDEGADKGKIYHLEQLQEVQNKRPNSGGVWEDVNKLYNFKDLENDKFIDLNMNCTEISDSPNPDCDRLQYDLVTPQDGDPVPLWFVREYLSHGRDLAIDMHDRALGLQANDGLRPALHSPSMLHFLNNRVSDSVVKLNEESQIVLFGTKVLQEKLLTEYNITPNTFLEFLRHHGFRVTGNKICRARQKRCNSLSKFRTIEGSCNNFRYPSWGQSNTAFVRVLPARYSDGIYALPLSVSGGPLPNPREVSAQLFSRRNATDLVFTLALMQWGQILAHDFARQVIDQTVEGGIECCDINGNGPLPKSLQHHSCLPIEIPTTDRFYANYGQTCMNFVRSMTVAKEDCSLGPANQLNGVSSFLDLSPVYGAEQSTSDSLREFQGGRMRVEIRADRVMMPTSAKSGYCDARTTWDICFETGDARTNQNPQLIVLQTLLIREHNRVAYELAALNPHWDDERLFQESRRIVIAEYQHITYRHWLPHVLGERYCKEHKVSNSHDRLSNDYNVKINPSTINSFTSGAFRFLHSMIEGNVNMVADNYGTSSTLRLSDYYFRPQIVEPENNFESLLRGLVYQTMQKPDANFHEEVTEYLFRSGNNYGMDLEAMDIQRGRDHGLPGYNAFRDICRLGRAEHFHGFINEISLNNIEKLQEVYSHVDDIDLLVGATMETRVPGSLLGPTLQCIIGEQFYRSRVGDTYFYNNADFPHSFTPEQFKEIKKASLATIICDLGEAVYQVQRDPFKVSSYRNPTVSCFDLPKINLELWKEEVYY